jgi:hypothetical protein
MQKKRKKDKLIKMSTKVKTQKKATDGETKKTKLIF